MSVKYITTGDEFAAKGLLGEGRHQLSILKNAMSFQNLQQLQRIVRFDDGIVIKCLSCFGQDVVDIFVPPVIVVEEEERKVAEVFYCWCTNYFTEGIITEVLGNYENTGNYGEEIYPFYCNKTDTSIKEYNGIRYKVALCQGNSTNEYICTSSDFTEYHIDDKIILFLRGNWTVDEGVIYPRQWRYPEETPKRGECRSLPEFWMWPDVDTSKRFQEPEERWIRGFYAGKPCLNDGIKFCVACKGNRRPEWVKDEVDGAFLVLPLEVEGVNKV